MNNMNNAMNNMNNELWQELTETDSEMLKGGAILIALLLPAVQAAREAASNSTPHDELSLGVAEQP
ncbi:MAG: hypothetical protein F6J95_019980 [Leptolyngbya sp. SIO1E4]|nr:hypothetical protein [Leptolyngbya sp. SIO1E4]